MKKTGKIISLTFVLSLLISSLTIMQCFAISADDYYLDSDAFYGDTDGDFKITVKDATAIQKYLAKIVELERKPKLLADVDGNGKLSISDATEIQKYLANIIYCFKASPSEHCKAGGDALRLELTTEESRKITVSVSVEGYYRFVSHSIEGGSCTFDVYKDVEYLNFAYGDASIIDTYMYLTPGNYTVKLNPSWEFEKDVIDFSVVLAADKTPFDFADVKEINAGEKLAMKAGSGSQAYKLDPACLENAKEGLVLYTEGENPKVSFMIYNEMLMSTGISDIAEDGVNSESEVFSDVCYAVVTQEEGGSDFTLCCDGYFDYIAPSAKKLELNKAQPVELTEHINPEGKSYRAYEKFTFTPSKSGYYKAEFKVMDDVWVIGSSPYDYLNEPEQIKLNRFFADEDAQYTVDYLTEGVTYYLLYSLIDFEKENSAELTISVSDEQEYNDWFNKFYAEDEFDEPEHTVVNLGEKTIVTISPEVDEYGYYEPEVKVFKFTADKDMTAVAYTEGSVDAYVNMFCSDGEYLGWFDNSGNLSEDFTVVLDLKAGESCILEISSTAAYGAEDIFFFGISDIEEYKELY